MSRFCLFLMLPIIVLCTAGCSEQAVARELALDGARSAICARAAVGPAQVHSLEI